MYIIIPTCQTPSMQLISLILTELKTVQLGQEIQYKKLRQILWFLTVLGLCAEPSIVRMAFYFKHSIDPYVPKHWSLDNR